MRLYCIFDEKARSICAVFQSLSDEAAVRSFEHLITAPEDNVFTLSFSDFSVKFIGEFNADVVSAFPTVLYGSSFSDSVISSKRIERQHLFAEFKSLKDIRSEEPNVISKVFDEIDSILDKSFDNVSGNYSDSQRDAIEDFYTSIQPFIAELRSEYQKESI